MSQIWKSRARKPVARGKATSGYYPTGVGGVLLETPCVYFGIDDHKLIMPVSEFIEWFEGLKRCDPEIASVILSKLK